MESRNPNNQNTQAQAQSMRSAQPQANDKFTYKGKKVTEKRPAKAGDAGFDASNRDEQFIIKTEDNQTERCVPRSELVVDNSKA